MLLLIEKETIFFANISSITKERKMASSASTSTNSGLILSAAALLLFLNIGALTTATPVHRPSTCSVCTASDRAKCPVVTTGPDCEVIQEPNCGCCKMCAKKLGENCGVATGFCETGLECIPPPITAEEYEEYGPADYFLEAALGDFICVTRKQFCDILSGAAYGDNNALQDESLYVPDLCQITDESSVEEPTKSYEEPTEKANRLSPIIPEIEPVVEFSTRPANPAEAPYQNALEPCMFHADKIWSKPRFDHHEWIPSCEEDGFYYPEQCELSFGRERGRCWCVDRMGSPVTKFIPGEEAHPDICISHKTKNNT